MSKFYGQVFGASDTPATRRGHNDITVSAQSWRGSVQTSLWYNDNDELCVRLGISDQSSSYGDSYFYGTLSDLKHKLNPELNTR